MSREAARDRSNWITVRTAAGMLGVSHNTLRDRIREKEIPVLGYLDGYIAVLDRGYIERLVERAKKARSASPAAGQ